MKKKPTVFYICTTAWNWEIGETEVMLYRSLADHKRHHKCWRECGVTKLTVHHETKIPTNMKLMLKNAKKAEDLK